MTDTHTNAYDIALAHEEAHDIPKRNAAIETWARAMIDTGSSNVFLKVLVDVASGRGGGALGNQATLPSGAVGRGEILMFEDNAVKTGDWSHGRFVRVVPRDGSKPYHVLVAMDSELVACAPHLDHADRDEWYARTLHAMLGPEHRSEVRGESARIVLGPDRLTSLRDFAAAKYETNRTEVT